jgi:hypothetical protein
MARSADHVACMVERAHVKRQTGAVETPKAHL